MARILILSLAALSLLLGQQPPKQNPRPGDRRDLDIVPSNPEPKRADKPSSPTPAVTVPNSYAVVIGVAQYENLPANLQLHFTERDAESIYTTLISSEGGRFPAENVHKLIGAKATLANMHHELEEWLPSKAKDDDRVLVYFAGHGFIAGGNGYLAPYDFNLKAATTTGYPMDLLGRVIGSKVKGKWKVLLTDSCHSGAIMPETSPEQLNGKLLNLNSSLFSLTASRDREQSFESPDFGGGHGIFTYYVVQGMEGAADANGDGIVTADELAEYVRRNVREASKAAQNPTSDRGSFDANMLLAYNPNGAKVGELPAPKDGTLVFETNMDGVELYVDEQLQGTLTKAQPLRLPGLKPGAHTIKAVKSGYEPDGPRQEVVYPGQESSVRIRILIPRHRTKAAVDVFDQGLKNYTNGTAPNYRKAEAQFKKALELDPTYSQAALYLARTENALFDNDQAAAAYEKAIAIDPDYVEAHAGYAGMLLDRNSTDEAIRHLNYVLQRDPKHAEAWYLLAEAYRMKGAYPESIDAARKAIAITPNNGEAHFWLAESLRMSGDYKESEVAYRDYLRLTNFDSKLSGQLNYYVLGYLIGFGRKTRASQADIWSDLRSLAYFGLCDCDKILKQYDSAIANCNRSLSYDPKDPYVHYLLGLVYAYKAQQTQKRETLAAAASHFRTMLQLNSDLEESGKAKKMLENFERELAK